MLRDISWIKVGAACYVVTSRPFKATITKVGRRWISVKTVAGRTYEFDKTSPHLTSRGPSYGYGQALRTVEEVEISQLISRIEPMLEKLEKTVRKSRF
jgi:hypothetical protein